MKFRYLPFVLTLPFLALTTLGYANVDQMKVYREVNPGLKPDCMYCHIDKQPKKDDGKHDLNAYGIKSKEAFDAEKADGMTKDEIKELYTKIFKKLGRHDEN